MFNKEKMPATDRFAPVNATIISKGTIIHGDVNSDNDLRIDGTVNGNIMCSAKVIIGDTGFIEGHIDGQSADISGKVVGNLKVKDILFLKGNCTVQGNIAADKLQVEPTATFNGQCQMGKTANIVQMSANELQTEIK